MTTTSAVAWCFLCCGITALFTALWWYAAHEQTKRAHARTFQALMFERAAHDDARRALHGCLDDCRRHGINGAARSKSHLTDAHSMPGPTLRRVK
jgi:hypothetical protein